MRARRRNYRGEHNPRRGKASDHNAARHLSCFLNGRSPSDHMTRQAQYFRKIYGTAIDRKLLRLLNDAGRPIVALTTRHPGWVVPHGELACFSIPAAEKMTRRGFDSLYYPDLVAVGLFKVFTSPGYYVIELHQIVAGVQESELERAFKDARAERVKSIRRAIEHMLKGRPETPATAARWTTVRPHSQQVEPKSEQWPEYIGWLRTNFRSLVFRYGCDRYWNRATKGAAAAKIEGQEKASISILAGTILVRWTVLGQPKYRPISTKASPRHRDGLLELGR